MLEPLIVSWGWESEFPGASRFVDEQEYTGTRDIAPYLAVPAAIEFQRAHDWHAVRRRCHELVREARERLLALDGVLPIHPDDPVWYAQMEAVRMPPCDAYATQVLLFERFGIEVVLHEWAGMPILRASIQGYNTRSDVDTLLAALTTLRAEGVF